MFSKNILSCYPDYHDSLQNIATNIYQSKCTCFYGFLFKFVNCFLSLKTEGILLNVTNSKFVSDAKYFFLESYAEYSSCELSCVRINCDICVTYLKPSFTELCNSIGIHCDSIVEIVHKEVQSFLIQQLSRCNQHL